MTIDKAKDFAYNANLANPKSSLIRELKEGDVGDSFACPYIENGVERKKYIGRLRCLARYYGIKLSIKNTIENGKMMIRAWRMS